MITISSISIKLLMLLPLFKIWSPQDFDFFYLVQQWPGSSCDTTRGCCFPLTGKPASNFSIHGLWPTVNDGSYPASCSITRNPFNQSMITDLIPRAEKSWPSLTCAGKKKQGKRSTALNLKDQVDLLQILQSNGIKPDGNFYSIVEMTKAIKQAIGVAPGITCNTDPFGNLQFNEIYLCVDTSASNFIECPVLPRVIRSCKEDNVEFPIF
ncbi:hypothetical protein VNO78_12225 [Psophocarpus tetragonolobus]|uniref:Uncharacterized protein n=1 Tax=Psophocarpus tetragonolobus TaxID=3891 RepID=A0AAN9XP32_PSOTE